MNVKSAIFLDWREGSDGVDSLGNRSQMDGKSLGQVHGAHVPIL